MRHKIAFYTLIITLFAFASCNAPSPKQPTIDSIVNLSEQSISDSKLLDNGDDISISEEIEETVQDAPETLPQEKPSTTKKQSSQPSMGGKETLYISTYGANGKVWGHVTMNGKKGHGTIHDEDENSYTITVTRHGAELFGIDQNGREYVFRL